MAKYINPAKVVTGVCRFSYANLWEAKAMDENSKPKYSVSLIIPKSDTKTIEKIRAAIQAAYEEAEDCNVGNNLFDLLSTDNAMSLFLKEHDVEFAVSDKHLNLIYKGKKVSLEDTNQEHIPYLRWRLGHNANRIDFCFNGFLLKDLLYRNSYARELYDVPEFIGVLATFLKRRNIGTDFFENSKYYCFEYCVPLQKIMFDDNEKLGTEQKRLYLLNQILNRLYEYHTSDIRYMFDHDNPIIRLADSDTMDEKYFVTKEKITWGMLG